MSHVLANGKNPFKKWMVIGAAILGVCAITTAGAFWLANTNTTKSKDDMTTATSTPNGRVTEPKTDNSPKVSELSLLDAPQFVAPSGEPYFPRVSSDDAFINGQHYPKYYAYANSQDPKTACRLMVENTTEVDLPGTTPQAIIERFTSTITKASSTPLTPTKEPDLVLSSATGSARYSLPTVSLTTTDDTTTWKAYYSAAIVKSGRRIAIIRACTTQGGTIDPIWSDRLNDLTHEVRVIAQ